MKRKHVFYYCTIACGIAAILTIWDIGNKYKIFNDMDYMLIFSSSIFIITASFLIYSVIRHIKEKDMKINSMLYNHAQHILMIEQCYKRDIELKDAKLLDTQELLGVVHPSKEQTSNNAKARKALQKKMEKEYPHLFKDSKQ